MAQKIIKIGSSIGVTIPKDVLEEAQLRVGDMVTLEKTPAHAEIRILPAKKSVRASKTAEWATEFVQRHIAAFKELADK